MSSMKLEIDEYGTLIDTRTGNTLLISGAALPTGHQPLGKENAKYIVKCVNEYEKVQAKSAVLDEVIARLERAIQGIESARDITGTSDNGE